MIIKTLNDSPSFELKGIEHVRKRIVIGPSDGSQEIVLRYFSLEPGGATPHHAHDFPHLVKVESGQGMVTDEKGIAHQLKQGDYVYVNDNETHQFKNTGSENFEFICIVPRRGEN